MEDNISIIRSLDEVPAFAKIFVPFTKENKIFVFYGAMGAGKTTLIKAICKELNVEDVINSPTFAIVNEYYTQTDEPIFHFDFYRINKLEEVYDFGYEDYFYSGHLCFIEWPEKIRELIPPGAVEVHITEKEDGREVRLKFEK